MGEALQTAYDNLRSSQASYASLSSATQREDLEAHLESVQQQKHGLQRAVEAQREQVKTAQERAHECDEKANVIDGLKKEEKARLRRQVPAVKHQLKLYKEMFAIDWKDTNEHTLSGFITLSKGGQRSLKQFALNKQQMTHFDLVLAMWDNYQTEIADDVEGLKQLMGAV